MQDGAVGNFGPSAGGREVITATQRRAAIECRICRRARGLHKLLSQIDHLDTLDDTMIARESTPCQANLGRWVVRLLKPGDLHIGQIARTVVFGQLNMLTNLAQAISTATEM